MYPIPLWDFSNFEKILQIVKNKLQDLWKEKRDSLKMKNDNLKILFFQKWQTWEYSWLKKKKKKREFETQTALSLLSEHMVGTDFVILCSLWYRSPHSGDIATVDSFRRLSDILEA